ncbi:MAG TPA: helix-turn-helix domain-containing protein [Thermoguttaceae bacterium]|nr:helix-turn-helix domain-containing protein [Thermoguttaceae bacterium]
MNGNLLEQRRRELGMSVAILAARSGVSKTSVKRILGGGLDKAAFAKVAAIAAALGMNLTAVPVLDSLAFQEEEARKKAERIMAVVQSSSALESQAVPEADYRAMFQRTVHELMAGPRRRLLAP